MGRDALTFHLQFSWVHFSCLGPPIELNMNGKGFEDKSKAYRFGELLGTIIAYTIIWVWIKPMNAVKKKLNMARIKKTKMNDGRIWITTVEDNAVAYWFKNYDNHGIIYDKKMNKVGSWKIVDN